MLVKNVNQINLIMFRHVTNSYHHLKYADFVRYHFHIGKKGLIN